MRSRSCALHAAIHSAAKPAAKSLPITCSLSAPAVRASPGLTERPHLDVERPRRAVLMRDVPDLVGDRRRLDEEGVRGTGVHLAGPGEIDDGIDHQVGDVDALLTEVARHRFG